MKKYIFIRESGCFKKIDVQDIFYLEAARNYTKIFTEKKTHLVHAGIHAFEKELCPEGEFCRIHKGFIVSISKLDSFDNSRVKLFFRREALSLPLGGAFKRNIKQCISLVSRDYFFPEEPDFVKHEELENPGNKQNRSERKKKMKEPLIAKRRAVLK
ncbi:MAG: LytTR family DNA-binding domain-containing protein [Puia sp.]|nr:LytTR family DNA-binding domain-containing protein [Puia sp.]